MEIIGVDGRWSKRRSSAGEEVVEDGFTGEGGCDCWSDGSRTEVKESIEAFAE